MWTDQGCSISPEQCDCQTWAWRCRCCNKVRGPETKQNPIGVCPVGLPCSVARRPLRWELQNFFLFLEQNKAPGSYQLHLMALRLLGKGKLTAGPCPHSPQCSRFCRFLLYSEVIFLPPAHKVCWLWVHYGWLLQSSASTVRYFWTRSCRLLPAMSIWSLHFVSFAGVLCFPGQCVWLYVE